MIALTCHCGKIGIEIASRPDFIHACNCSLCSKSGALWGYFDPSQVVIDGIASTYRRADKPEPAVDIGFCANCGSTTHFTLTPGAAARFGNAMVGVNMRLADTDDIAGVELRFPDGRAWSGTGEFGYLSPPRIIGAATPIE